jgi:cardiolipin synthase
MASDKRFEVNIFMSFSMLPNALSILRIILTVPIVIALLKEQYFLVMVLFFSAGVTDALDGWLAKQYSLQSRLGSILDPMADKILLTCTFITLYWIAILPFWLLLLIFFRDLIIVAATVGYFLGQEESENERLQPTWISKLNTVLQIILVLFVVLAQMQEGLIEWLEIAFIVVATSTALSGADYMWLWVRKFVLQETKK